MANPLFILGCPRSGTTLLAGLLEPTAYGAPIETHFIVKYYNKIDQYGDIKKKDNFIRLLNDILSERPVQQWNLTIDKNDFFNSMDEIDYKTIVDKLCMIRSNNMGLKFWGDKTPFYTLYIDIIYKLFPDAKYIYIVRDGRDVALSLLERPWGPNNVVSCAKYWKKFNIYSFNESIFKELINKKKLYITSYEKLLGNAKEVMSEIYDFLEEPYDDERMNKLVNKIKINNFNKWKSVMSKYEIELFEKIASDTLKQFDYEFTYKEVPINQFMAFYSELQDKILRAKHLFRLNVIDTIKIKYFGKEPFAE